MMGQPNLIEAPLQGTAFFGRIRPGSGLRNKKVESVESNQRGGSEGLMFGDLTTRLPTTAIVQMVRTRARALMNRMRAEAGNKCCP